MDPFWFGEDDVSDSDSDVERARSEANHLESFSERYDDDDDEPQVGLGTQNLPDDIRNHVLIEPIGEKRSRKFGLRFNRFKISVHNLEQYPFARIPSVILLILEYILTTVLADVQENEYVRLHLESTYLDIPIWIPPMLKSQLTVERWMEEVERVLNSQQQFLLDDSFLIEVDFTESESGRCVTNVPVLLRNKLLKLRCVLPIRNSDDICLARALVVAKTYADHTHERKKREKKTKLVSYQRLHQRKKEQTKAAKKLIKRAGLEERAFSIADIPRFEEVLTDYQIIVVGTAQLNCIIYKSVARKKKKILLLLHSNHFDVLKSLPAWFRKSYWCFECDVGYDMRTQHRCEFKCNACCRVDCPKDESSKIKCFDCLRFFNGDNCFNHHKLSGENGGNGKPMKPICHRVFVCRDCSKLISMNSRSPDNLHQCGESRCSFCSVFDLPSKHACFMPQYIPKEKDKKAWDAGKFLFFDFETYVNDEGELIPNFAVIQDHEGTEAVFPEAGENIGDDITDRLCEYIFQPCHAGYFVIAHNFRVS